ncbi:hypothetical protein [Globicatella sanguinis]
MNIDLLEKLIPATGSEIIKLMKDSCFPNDVVVLDCSRKGYSSFLSPQSFGDRYFLNSVMDFSKTSILNKQILKQNNFSIEVRYLASFDSNILGDIVTSIFNSKPLNEDLEMAINFLKENDMQLDSNPYLLEAYLNRYDMKKVDIHKSLQAFEVLDYFDDLLDGSLSDTYAREKLHILQSADIRMEKISAESYSQTPIIKYYILAYVLLLKAFLIKNRDNKLDEKIDELLSFIVEEIPIFAENEVITSILYLQNNRELERFLRVKENTNNKLAKLSGMAWDLTHIRYVELIMRLEYGKFDKLTIPYLLSGDKGLNSIMAFNPVKRIIIVEERPIFLRTHNLHNVGLNQQQIERMLDWKNSNRSVWNLRVEENIKQLIRKLEEVVDDL